MPPPPTLPMPAGAIPRVGYGTGTFWGHYRTGVPPTALNPALVAAVAHAVGAGVRHLDCAEMYGSELSVGEGLRQALAAGGVAREELWVTSKALNESKTDLRAACVRSMARLGVAYLDLYLLHSPFGAGDAELSAAEQQRVWRQMEALHAEGLVRNIGCSNHRVSDLQAICAAAQVRPSVNQVEFNPGLLAVTEPTLAWCAAEGIVVEAYSALSSLVYDGAKGGPLDAVVDAIAAAHGVGSGAVLLVRQLSLFSLVSFVGFS